jgi:hypothetical protein
LYGLLRISTDEPDSLLELAGFLPHQEIEKRMKKSLRVCRFTYHAADPNNPPDPNHPITPSS